MYLLTYVLTPHGATRRYTALHGATRRYTARRARQLYGLAYGGLTTTLTLTLLPTLPQSIRNLHTDAPPCLLPPAVGLTIHTIASPYTHTIASPVLYLT